jgi:hypothetical protein
MGVSKVVFGGNTLIDLTNDKVTKDNLLVGATAHGADGEFIEGACPYDCDTSQGNANDNEVLEGRVAFVRGSEVKGKMKNNGKYENTISSINEVGNIPLGFHDGSGGISIAQAEKDKLIPSNIREGKTILGVTGTMSGAESVTAEAKSVIPSMSIQTIVPTGADYLSQVTVAAIPYEATPNTSGGTTYTIG